MKITQQNNLTENQKAQLFKLWNSVYPLICLFFFTEQISAQDTSRLKLDLNKTEYIDCTSKYGHHAYEIKNHSDSLNCLVVSSYTIPNSDSILSVERNFYGDTLGIGFKYKVEEKVKFWAVKKPLFKKKNLVYYRKIGEWIYYDPISKAPSKKVHLIND